MSREFSELEKFLYEQGLEDGQTDHPPRLRFGGSVLYKQGYAKGLANQRTVLKQFGECEHCLETVYVKDTDEYISDMISLSEVCPICGNRLLIHIDEITIEEFKKWSNK